jgi:hypothetical protein
MMKRFLILSIVLLAVLALLLACQPTKVPTQPTPMPTAIAVFEPTSSFATGAFPPPMPLIEQHKDAWLITDCLGCHDKDAGEAPTVKHKDLPEIYLNVNCRTCHVPKPAE